MLLPKSIIFCVIVISGWRFYKLHLKGVCLLDYYGGATRVSLEDYFSARPLYQIVEQN